MSNIAIFASGSGTNTAKMIDYFNQKVGQNKVKLVLSNKPKAGVVDLARKMNVKVGLFTNTEFEEGSKIISLLEKEGIEWIVLAGFLRKIPMNLVTTFNQKIFNVHPSLLPKFGGKGMYGSRVHQAVIEQQEKESGITIHLIDQEYDRGEILHQAKCKVSETDTVESLAKKVQKLEHEFFPKVVEDHILNSEN